jgi:acetyltransferase-like isoleucine patch superfamily enzyme
VKFLIESTTIIRFYGKARLEDYVEIGGKGEIVAGNHLVINPFSRIISEEKIILGKNVLIARYVSILDHDHNIESILNGDFKTLITKPITIGDNVWIGDKVTICKGVTIGSNVVIGANSVVTKDIPSNSIVAGIPCKLIKSI